MPDTNLPGSPELGLGSLVELAGTAAEQARHAALSARGHVTGLITAPDETVEIAVRCPGDTRSHLFAADELAPAPAFREVFTYQGFISDPSAAETCLVRATARVVAADHRDLPPRHEDIQDHHALLTNLSAWCGLQPEQLAELVLPKVANRLSELEHELDPWGDLRPAITPTTPPQVALAAFPISLHRGVPAPPPPPDLRAVAHDNGRAPYARRSADG